VGYLYLIQLEQGSGRANRKWCARTGWVDVYQVGEGGYIWACAGGITVVYWVNVSSLCVDEAVVSHTIHTLT